MTRAGVRTSLVDFGVIRRRGDAAEKEALARRIFALWRPIFEHLDVHDHTFHLAMHVEDESAVQIRGLFGIDESGQDRALMIVRVHEHVIAGRTWARLTINAGYHPSLVQSQFGQDFLAWEAWRYRLRHPLRPFFVVDCAVSAASYCAYAKTYAGFAPTRERPIPDAWWPFAEVGAAALRGVGVEGAQREVRRFPGVVRIPTPQRMTSKRSREAARFFNEITGGDRRNGVLVMAPLGFLHYGYTTARYGWVRCRRLVARARGASR